MLYFIPTHDTSSSVPRSISNNGSLFSMLTNHKHITSYYINFSNTALYVLSQDGNIENILYLKKMLSISCNDLQFKVCWTSLHFYIFNLPI